MDPLTPGAAGHHLHRARFRGAPVALGNFQYPAAARWEHRGVPAEQAVRGERGIVLLSRVEDHLDHAFDAAICRSKRANIDAQAARERGVYLILVEHLAFDLARLHDFFRQRLKIGLRAYLEAEPLHAPDESSLAV